MNSVAISRRQCLLTAGLGVAAGWPRSLAWLLVTGGLVVFGVRTVILALRFRSPGPPR